MPDEFAARPEAVPTANGGRGGNGDGTDFATLRRLLIGPEQVRLEEIATELKEQRKITAADMAEHLPEAITLRALQDSQVGLALAPTIDTTLRASIRRNPEEIADAIFPVLGPTIRKAIAEALNGLVRSINTAMEHAITLRGIKWRWESWRTGVPYAELVLKHALVYRVEQAFLVHARSGLLLAHAAAPGFKAPDAAVISGMLMAIQDFVHDAFRPGGEGARLRTFSVGELTVQVEAGPMAFLALVIRGEAPPELLRKQQRALEAVHLHYASALEDFTGDAAAFQSACLLLDECLETIVATPMERHGRWYWVRWAVPVLAVFVALVLLAERSRARFERAVATLEDEPGMLVIHAGRGWKWGNWTVTGLRDPDARTPQAVLAGAGLLPRSLSGRWESFVSLDSSVVVARARAAWRLPSSTRLSLDGTTIRVSGEVPLAAVRLLTQPGLPAGVSNVSLDSVSIVLPAHLDSMRQSIAGDRVLFALGESSIDRGTSASIRRTAARFAAFSDSAVTNSADVILTLFGRTDPTGTRERNASLAQWRIDRVKAILVRAGVRAEQLREEALALARPLDAPDSAQRARINRSVSYGIAVSARLRRSNER